jgi:uncharacterized repeat protein (TIGR01451 family)
MFPFLNKQPIRCNRQSFIKETTPLPMGWLTGSALLLLAAIPAPAAAQVVLFDETFANPQVAIPGNFDFGIGDTPVGSDPSDPPCLTAAPPVANPPTSGRRRGIPACRTDTTSPTPPFTPDPVGNGTLRLTPSKQNQAAFVLFNNPPSRGNPQGGIPSANGLVITFDFFSYNGSGADGISFFLINAATGRAVDPVAGAFGGSLGYANRTSPNNLSGVVGGYVGVGFDEFGNYSNGNEGRLGGSPNPTQPDGRVPDAVAVRGSEASGYRYVSGTTTLPPTQSIDQPAATNRLAPGVQRTARITLTPDNQISVDVDFRDGAGFVNLVSPISLNPVNGQGTLPPSLNFGFAGSTGTTTNIHEIQNIRITTIPPDVNIVKTGPPQFTVGTPGAYTLNVQNSPSAGSTSAAITVTDTLPPGFEFISATGTNWNCSAVEAIVTCNYTGSVLGPGASAPPITINVLPTGALGNNPTATNTATVNTPGDENPGDNTTTIETPVVAAPLIRAIKSSEVIDANGNGIADPGEVIAYTIAIANQGNAPSTNTVFTDDIPANTTYVPNSSVLNNQALADSSGTSPFVNGSPVNSPSQAPSSGILNPGTPETATVQFQVRINNPLPEGVVQIQNQALIVSDQVREPPVLTNPPINTGPTINPIGPTQPLLRLVKRITGLNTTNYTNVIDENPALWPLTVQPVGRPDLLNPQTLVRSDDQVEYTIYFISAGSRDATNVQICDAIPAGTTFINNSFAPASGVLLNQAGTQSPLTNASDTDLGSFLSPLVPVPSPPCADANNPNGSILLNLGDIPAGNAGFVRFRVKID